MNADPKNIKAETVQQQYIQLHTLTTEAKTAAVAAESKASSAENAVIKSASDLNSLTIQIELMNQKFADEIAKPAWPVQAIQAMLQFYFGLFDKLSIGWLRQFILVFVIFVFTCVFSALIYFGGESAINKMNDEIAPAGTEAPMLPGEYYDEAEGMLDDAAEILDDH